MAAQPTPQSRYGQHFLVDQAVLQKEIAEAELTEKDTVLEIGAGTGVLTEELAAQAGHVIAIEPDGRCMIHLEKLQATYGNITIHNKRFEDLETMPGCDKCISNIPFHLSATVTAAIAQHQILSVLIYQKEFAQRLVAEPPSTNYSRISVVTQLYMIPVYLENISPAAFSPQPHVSCALVKLYPRTERPKIPEEPFFQFITALFSHSKNTVRKALKSELRQLGMQKNHIDQFPYTDKRVRELDVHALQELANVWMNLQRT